MWPAVAVRGWSVRRGIVVVFAPEAEHRAIQEQLETAGPYRTNMPAFVDAHWGLERMIGEMAGIVDIGPFPD